MTGRGARRTLPAVAALAVTALAASLLAGCGVRPSGVITGGPAPRAPGENIRLYLVSDATLTPVVRPAAARLTPTQTLEHLLAGPDGDEQAQGYTTQVPPDLAPAVVAVHPSSVMVNMAGDPAGLSDTAVNQIVCTVSDAVIADQGAAGLPVILVGQGRSRGPRACPLLPH